MTVSELILETAIKEAGDVCDVRLEKAFAEELLEILREHNTMHSCLKAKCCICPHCRDCDVDEKGKIKSGQDSTTIEETKERFIEAFNTIRDAYNTPANREKILLNYLLRNACCCEQKLPIDDGQFADMQTMQSDT